MERRALKFKALAWCRCLTSGCSSGRIHLFPRLQTGSWAPVCSEPRCRGNSGGHFSPPWSSCGCGWDRPTPSRARLGTADRCGQGRASERWRPSLAHVSADVNGGDPAHVSVLVWRQRVRVVDWCQEELQWEQSEQTDRRACCAYHAAPGV